jgi:AcrR family transcriptional regulator
MPAASHAEDPPRASLDGPSLLAVDRETRERRRILRAAAQLIGQQAERQTTIADVLRAAGVNRRIFYRHFRSKDQLVMAMLERAGHIVETGLSKTVAASADPAQALASYVEYVLKIGWDEYRAREGRAFLSPEVGMTAGISSALEAVYARHRAILREVLARGLADGSLPRTVPDRDAFAIHAVLIRYLEVRVRGQLDLEFADVLEAVTGLFLPALGGLTAG